MARPTRKQAQRIADERGLTLNVDKFRPNRRLLGGTEVQVQSPHGQHFEEGIHELIREYIGEPTDWAEIIERMSQPLEACQSDCEWCYPA